MSEEMRKHLRTQGKYSNKGGHSDEKGFKNRDKRQKISPTAKEPPEKKFQKRNSNGNKGAGNSSTDESTSPLKYEENCEYAFSELEEPKKPMEIKGRGKHILSKTDNGESMIFYEPRFMYEEEGNDYYDRFHNVTNWHEKNIVIHGVEYPQPRLVAWYGPFPYSYSGATLEPADMPDAVMEIKEKVEEYLAATGIDVKFNSVLLNLYRDGKDSVSWHSDDELTMGISPTIASVSLGETRKFEMRRKQKHYEEESSSDQMNQWLIHLTHGSLLIMTGCMQDDWQHRVPKEYHDKGARINLTFRTVHPLEKVPEHVPAKENIKEPVANYSSNKTSSCEINFDDDFPPLKSDISPACPNVKYNKHERTQYPCLTLKKETDVSCENWDSEISDDEQNVQNGVFNSVHSYESTCVANDNKYEDCIIENNRSLSSVTNHIKVSVESPVNATQGNSSEKKEHPKMWHNVDANSSVNNKDNSGKKDSSKEWCNVDANGCDNQKNNFKKEHPVKWDNAEVSSAVTLTLENDLDKKEHPYKKNNFEANSPVNDIQENNLDKKEPPKTGLNVEAKEFVPVNNIPSFAVQYSQFDLEDLIHYEIDLMEGGQLQDLAYTLKDKVLERLYEFRRFDREELEFLCTLTDGSQTDKNQKLISARICNTVINALERNLTSPNIRRSFNGNSRQRGYGNQNQYSDRIRRFQNQGRSNNHRN